MGKGGRFLDNDIFISLLLYDIIKKEGGVYNGLHYSVCVNII